MAGIIVDMSDDIQKLQKIKAEIAGVKQELKGLDIRVNLDIKENLEFRLQSLMGQYDALVSKIAEAEGKIMLSVKRINDASEKIIRVQENLSKAGGGTVPTSNPGVSSTTAAETASVQAQSRAYDELKDEIESIIGTRSQNIKRMVDETNAIRLINAEIKKITKSQGDSASLSSAQQKRLEQLNNSLLTHKTALAEVRQYLNSNVKLDSAAATSMNGLSQSLSRMRMTYRELTEEERNSPFGKELLASIQQADSKIKELDATIGNHQRNVGDYAKQWNGLQYQMQMVARELPNFAINPQIGIMSLTNNIPYLVDELKKAKDAHKAYIAEVRAGNKDLKAVPSVGKQILSSLLNWQTAIIMAVTLITAYRKEISDWVSGLFKAKDAVKEMLSAEQEMALARKTAASNSLKERTELDLLYTKLKDTTLSTKERNAAVSEWMKKHPQHSNIMNGELVSLGKLESAYHLLSKQIVETAKARAYSDKITELTKKREEAESKRLNSLNTLEKSKAALAKNGSDLQKTITKNAQKQYDVIAQEVEEYDKRIAQIQKKIKVDDLFPQPKEGTHDYWQQQAQIADAALKQIDSKQKILLDQAAKDPKRDLYGLGIDKTIVDAYKEAIKKKKEAEKELKVYDSFSKQEKEAAKQKQLQQKLSDDLLSLRHKNQQKEVSLLEEGREKKLRQIAADFEAEETEIRKRSREFADTNKKKGTTGLNSYGLTPEQQAEIDKANRLNADSRAKAESDVYKAEAQAMRDYLKEYGTFQQQKLAIAEEYAEKIKKAQSESERKTLEKQRDSALLNVDVKAARQEIDWQSVFGDLGLMLKEQVQPTIDNLKKIIQSEQFQNSSVEDQQKIYEILSRLEKQSGTFGKDMFKEVARDLELYRNSLNAYHAAQEREIEASENLAKAKEKLKEAQENGGDTKSAQQAVDEAQEAFDRASESVRTFGEKATENASTLQSSSEKVRGALEGFAGGLEQLKSGFLSQAFEGIKNLGPKLGGKLGDAISKIDPTGIIGGVLAIMDVLKDGVSSIFVSLQDTMYEMIEGVLDDLFSGDILTKPLTNAFSHMGNILNTVTFGGFDSWFNIGGNAKETAEKIERLTASNDALKTSIDNLKEELEGSNGTKSIEAYNEAVDAQKRYNENLRQILDAQMRYNAAHHSNSYYWNLDKNSLSQVNRLLGTSLKNTWSAFSQLTAEQMNEIRTHLPDVWREMVNQGKYGDRFKEDWDNYADQAGKVVEMTDSLRENLAQISFDSLRDSFVDALMDMDASAEDFADNFEEYMTRSLLNFAVGDNIDEKMKLWYESWTNTMNAQHGRLTEKQIEDYRAQWNGFVEEGIKTRDEIAGLTGYEGSGSSSGQSSTRKGFATASQDSIDELNGRFTAGQIAWEETKNQSVLQTQALNLLTAKADVILSMNTETRNIADDTRDLISKSYLELVQISENTGNSAKYLKDIKADIAEVKKNTSKL